MSGHGEIDKSDDTKYNIVTENEEKLLLGRANFPLSLARFDPENSLVLRRQFNSDISCTIEQLTPCEPSRT